MSKDLNLKLNRAKDLGVWIHAKINGKNLPRGDRIRVRIGVALLHLALEHYNAINVLITERLYGSAFALARPLLESYSRSIWVLYCATDKCLEDIKNKNSDLPGISNLIEIIGKQTEPGVKEAGAWLKKIKEKNIKQFHDLTHGGILQAVRRITEEGIESNYPEEELSKLLEFSIEVAIQIACRFFVIAKNESLLAELNNIAFTIRSDLNNPKSEFDA